MTRLVTLTGGSGAGKTTVALTLARTLEAELVHMDDFYATVGPGRPVLIDDTGTARLDVGDPLAIDWQALNRKLGRAGTDYVILEGLFASHHLLEWENPRADLYLDAPDDLRLVRKIQRKVLGGELPLEVLLWNYVHHRRSAFIAHTLPLRERSSFVVDGSLPSSKVTDTIVRLVESFEWDAPAEERFPRRPSSSRRL